MLTTARVLHFPAGDRRFSLPIEAVGEIAEVRTFDPVPGAPAEVAGLAEFRGRIVTLLSLAGPTPVPAGPSGRDSRVIAVLLAGPLAHLGVVVRGQAGEIEISGQAPDEPDGAVPQDGPVGSGPAPFARAIRLEDGRAALLIDPEELAEYATGRVRECLRIAERG